MEGVNPWSKSVWGRSAEDVEEPIVSFAEIMSEELAHQLEDGDPPPDPNPSSRSFVDQLDMCDEEFARALQREFDREYDLSMRLQHNPRAGCSTVTMTQDRYCPHSKQDEEEEEEAGEDELRELTTAQLYKMTEVLGPVGGIGIGPNGEWVTKHDPAFVSARNVDKAMNDVLNVDTGDVLALQVHSQAHVFNKLRTFSKKEQKRFHRVKDKEEKAVMDTSVDALTRLTLFKWINQGLFNRIDGIIATGKESAVLSASGNSSLLEEDSFYLAIKVYKTSLVEFKNRSEYVQNDFRFKNPRGVMKIWAEKEFMNLNKMFNKNLPCPEPIKLRKNIMVMAFIGKDGIASAKLKDCIFEDESQKSDAFAQVKDIVIRMYRDCRLVHGDLSEFNLLMNEDKVYVIDVAQAMDLCHPRVHSYLVRDIDNVLNFFGKIGTPDLPKRVELFNTVTDLTMSEEEDLYCQVEDYEATFRNIQLRLDKTKPADMELRQFIEDEGAQRVP